MKPSSFSDLNLLPQIQRALQSVDYSTPTPIQAAAIPHLMAERDLLGCAQTGTGKTAAFALPILHRLGSDPQAAKPHNPRVLVIAPTRELAAQIDESFRTYGRYSHLRQAVVFGGVSQIHQVRALSRGVHVLIATPGRLLDLMNQGHVRLDRVEIFVLDEADRMLDMGFLPDLKRIIARLPKQRHSLFFSATMPPRVAELARSLLTDPVRVEVTPQSSTVESIEQQVLFVPQREKQGLLSKILQGPNVGQVLVFTRTKRGADNLTRQLNRHGMTVEAIHGNKSQNARTRTLQKFRRDQLQVLVATDLAARGLDVQGLSHVVNYDLPLEPECYVHRIGRTGRAGARGIALSFCDPGERSQLRAIEKLIKQSLPVHADHPDCTLPQRAASRPPQKNSKGRRFTGRPASRPGSRRPSRATV